MNATSVQKNKPAPIDFDDQFSADKISNHSKAVLALVSQRELSKQKSFNSPTSLSINMTNERIRNSIDDSTVRKRKIVMLDEAAVSKQSLQFGKSNHTNQSSLIGNLLSGTGSSSINRSPSRNIAKINLTSQNFNENQTNKENAIIR